MYIASKACCTRELAADIRLTGRIAERVRPSALQLFSRRGDDYAGGPLFSFFQELFGVQQRTLQAPIIGGPLRVWFALEMRAHALHLGIKVVEVVQHERFREHGEFA